MDQVHPAEIAPAGQSLPRLAQSNVLQDQTLVNLPALQQVQVPAIQQAQIPLQQLQTPVSPDSQQVALLQKNAEPDAVIYDFPAHVTTGFSELFKDSEDIKGLACMEKANGVIYKYTHMACYGSLTVLLTPFIAFFWALFFGCLNHTIVWFVQPFYKAFYIIFRLCHMVYRPIIRQCLEPLSRLKMNIPK